MMGAVEPSCEKAMEPFEAEMEGDCGPGLEVLLESREVERPERRLIHEGRREGLYAAASTSSMLSCSLGGV